MNHDIQYPVENYVVWDLETSGLDPKVDKILEIGWVVMKNGSEAERGSVLLNHPGFEVPELITNITGITTEMCREQGIVPAEALTLLNDKLGGYPHVTHNGIRFDIDFFLSAIGRGESGKFLTGEEWDKYTRGIWGQAIDTAVLFKAGKLGRRRRFNETFVEFANRVMDERVFGLKYNVGVCCDELGIEKGEQHRALGDVLLTKEIYKKLTV